MLFLIHLIISFQGVNLGNIVKDASLYVGGTLNGQPMEHPVIGSLKKLSKLLEGGKADNADVCACLKAFESECDIDLSRRCLAGTNGAYPVLFRACEKYRSEPAMLQRCVSALCALCNGQPDVLDIRGTVLFTQLLDEYRNDVETLETTVKLIRLLCIKHENNRQGFVTEKLITKLVSLIEEFKAAGSLVKEICFALRVLTFDDDIRVPFGKGHEHAKMIVAEGNALRTILNICNGKLWNFMEYTRVVFSCHVGEGVGFPGFCMLLVHYYADRCGVKFSRVQNQKPVR